MSDPVKFVGYKFFQNVFLSALSEPRFTAVDLEGAPPFLECRGSIPTGVISTAVNFLLVRPHLSRTSENLVTSADARTDLVVLRLRVTVGVEFGLGDQTIDRSSYSQLQDRDMDAPERP